MEPMTSSSGSRNLLPRVTVRSARLEDAEATRQIYNAEVTTSTVTFDLVPRSLAEQRDWLTARSGAHAVLVAEDEAEGVVGFASLSPWGKRPAYATSVEDSVYVHRDHRGRGIGKALLRELLDVATAHGFHAVFARIVGDQGASATLHEALGFEVVGTEREVGRKFGRWLDVVVMELLLTRPGPGGPYPVPHE
jgi:L-amino acid N-acyltransferase YncA